MILASHGIIGSQIASFNADAAAFFARVTAAGGSLSTTEKQAVNQLVLDMKTNGIWSSMKAIYPMVGASAAACAQNLKSSSFTGSFSTGWSFSSNGVTPNGTTSCFFDTNFEATSFTLTNNAFGFYTRSNIISNQGDMGALDDNSANQINMGANYIGAGAFARNFSTSYGGATNTNTQGFYSNSRIVSTEFKMYKNGSVLQTIASSTGTALSGVRMALGGHMNAANISVSVPSTKQYAFAFLSDGLTDTQASNFYTAVQAFQTMLSRNV